MLFKYNTRWQAIDFFFNMHANELSDFKLTELDWEYLEAIGMVILVSFHLDLYAFPHFLFRFLTASNSPCLLNRCLCYQAPLQFSKFSCRSGRSSLKNTRSYHPGSKSAWFGPRNTIISWMTPTHTWLQWVSILILFHSELMKIIISSP